MPRDTLPRARSVGAEKLEEGRLRLDRCDSTGAQLHELAAKGLERRGTLGARGLGLAGHGELLRQEVEVRVDPDQARVPDLPHRGAESVGEAHAVSLSSSSPFRSSTSLSESTRSFGGIKTPPVIVIRSASSTEIGIGMQRLASTKTV